jgi:Tol biopolymer transport system component
LPPIGRATANIFFYQRGAVGNQDIWALPLEGDRKPFQVVPSTPNTLRTVPKLSPDGHWLAYLSNESGSYRIPLGATTAGSFTFGTLPTRFTPYP